jgi:hypothetical protein
MNAFHITQWDTLYETAASRKVVTLSYYSKPNKLVGEGIGATLAQEDAEALLGTWALIEALASTAPFGFRGWLVRNGSALDAPRMAALTRRPKEKFERALEWFARPEIGWLELIKLPADFPTKPQQLKTAGGLPGDSASHPPVKTEKPQSTETAGGLPGRFRHDDEVVRMRKRGGSVRTAGGTAHTLPAPQVPSLAEVMDWATQTGLVHPDFAQLKFSQASERGDFAKAAWRKNWRSKFERFWREDGREWMKKFQKNAAAPGARPDGWMAGDQDFWWTDSVADLRGVLQGAAVSDQKTAARLREIIAKREGKQ